MGGATWLTGSYDPDLGLLYWPIGNPAPDWNGDSRPGDNLYTDSLVALDVNTGEMQWYFQYTPHDVHDWDANQIPVLVDAEWEGTTRKLVIHANRNAFYYVLDRETGQFLRATQYATQTWAERIDENGRPVRVPNMEPSEEGTLVWPSLAGSTNWYSPAYDPDRMSLFVPTREMSSIYFKSEAEYEPGTPFLGGGERRPDADETYGAVRALDALTGELKWEFKQLTPAVSGVMATAGGVVFSGTQEGNLFALDADTGEALWDFYVGGGVRAAPMSFALNGQQYVSIAAGQSIFTFALSPGDGGRGQRRVMRRAAVSSAALLWVFTTGCGGSGEREPTAEPAAADPAAGPLLLVSNEDGGTLSVVATTTHEVLAEIEVGRRPRGVRASPDGGMAYVAVSGSPKCPPWMEEEGCAEPDKRFDGIAEVDLRQQVRTRMLPGGSDPESFDITPDGARIVVSNEDTDEASLVDLESGEIFRTVPVGAEPEGVRINPDGTLAYVTGETDHDVTVLDTSTGDEITRITVGHRPRDLVFTPDGTYAYVSAEISGDVSEIVVAENRVSRTIALPEGSRSMGVALSPDAGTLYVANGRSKTVSVIDLASGEVTANVEVGERPWGLALSFDGSRLYTANGPSNDVTVLDTATLEIVTRIEVGAGPWGLALVP